MSGRYLFIKAAMWKTDLGYPVREREQERGGGRFNGYGLKRQRDEMTRVLLLVLQVQSSILGVQTETSPLNIYTTTKFRAIVL